MTKDRSNVAYFVTRAIDDCDPHRYDESDLHSMEAHGRRMPRIGPGIVYWTKSWVPPLGRRNQDDSTNVLGEGGIGLGRGKGLGIPKVDGGGIGTLSEIVGLASPVDGDVREAIVVQGEAVLLDIVAEPTHREDIKARHVTDDILAIGWGLQVVIEGNPGGSLSVGVDKCVVLTHVLLVAKGFSGQPGLVWLINCTGQMQEQEWKFDYNKVQAYFGNVGLDGMYGTRTEKKGGFYTLFHGLEYHCTAGLSGTESIEGELLVSTMHLMHNAIRPSGHCNLCEWSQPTSK
ncbi:hypothetical protein B0O80DRAFT_432474 [Mortierella sp. GBAus27b]|nr:hypothetical protein B0O80DRAFT_432474 [Mortierella sp. GBAus27b]